jgi:hypothetical protein
MTHDKIQFVTANFSQLQGLRLIPLGLYLLAVAASGAGWLFWLPGGSSHAQERWLGAAFCVALVSAVVAGAYYRSRYGSLDQCGRTHRNWLIAAAVAVFIGAAQLDHRFHGMIALAPLWAATALVLVVRADGWLRRHFLLAAAPWFAIAWVPPLHADGGTRLVTYAVAGALSLIICGLGDHRLIAKTLSPVRM